MTTTAIATMATVETARITFLILSGARRAKTLRRERSSPRSAERRVSYALAMALDGRAKNELLFREVNGRLSEIADGQIADFLCECADVACLQAVSLTLDAYNAIRASPTDFFVARGHEDLDIEEVVRDEDGYLVVAKLASPAAS